MTIINEVVDALYEEKTELTILKKKSILLLKNKVPIWDYIIGQIAEAYHSIGWTPYILDIEEEASISQTLELIKAGLDRVLLLNNVGYFLGGEETNIWDIYGINICNYLLDHPFYYQEILERSPSNTICVCVDRNHVKYIDRFCRNVRKAVFLPLAGDNELDDITYEWRKREIDVLFVGNYKGYKENGMPDAEFYILLEELMNNTQITFEAAVEQMLRLQNQTYTYDTQIKACVEKNKYIDANIMAYYRCKLIEVLIKSSIDVVVHGAGWESFEYFHNPHFIYGGTILHEECIEKMKESKIVLNIMPWFKDGIHDRVINAMLTGAVCVTDDSIYMSEAFEKDKDYICYSLDAMEKLPDMISGILDNEDTTQEMRQNAYQKAKEGHRWLHRIKELETLLDEEKKICQLK
jgi:glycosyltransferase involved in cell wall biosynthesis